MPELKLELFVNVGDGLQAVLADCEWVFHGTCGCALAARRAVDGDEFDEFLGDEATALAHAFPDGVPAGTTGVLMTREEYVETVKTLGICPHRGLRRPSEIGWEGPRP